MCRMPRTGRHPLGVAVGDQPAAAVGVLVGHLAVDHVGDGLEAAVRVPRRALGLARRVLDLAHLVEVHERVEVGQVDAGERPADREALALEAARRRRHRATGRSTASSAGAGMRGSDEDVVDGHGWHAGGTLRRRTDSRPIPGRESVARVIGRAGRAWCWPPAPGRRLRPLTDVRPKALCTVGGRPLLDLGAGAGAAVRRPYGGQRAPPPADQLLRRAGRPRRPRLRRAPARRWAPPARSASSATGSTAQPVLLTNADALYPPDLAPVGRPARRLGRRAAPAALRPPRAPGRLRRAALRRDRAAALVVGAGPGAGAGRALRGVLARRCTPQGRLDLVVTDAAAVDCGTPADYLRANMLASGGALGGGAGRAWSRASWCARSSGPASGSARTSAWSTRSGPPATTLQPATRHEAPR